MYAVCVDGSGRVTIRNRKFCSQYSPVNLPSARHNIDTDLQNPLARWPQPIKRTLKTNLRNSVTCAPQQVPQEQFSTCRAPQKRSKTPSNGERFHAENDSAIPTTSPDSPPELPLPRTPIRVEPQELQTDPTKHDTWNTKSIVPT